MRGAHAKEGGRGGGGGRGVVPGRRRRAGAACRVRCSRAPPPLAPSRAHPGASHGLSSGGRPRRRTCRYLPYLRLKGLSPDTKYVLEELIPNTAMRDIQTGQLHASGGPPQYQLGQPRMLVSGASLMQVGLPVRLSFDGDCVAFRVTSLDEFKAQKARETNPSSRIDEGVLSPTTGTMDL